MAEGKSTAIEGPDLRAGVELDKVAEAVPLLGHVDDEPVILVRQGKQVFAIGAVCSHYSGPLSDGLVVNDTIRCPWHHAQFSLHNGEAIGAPALDPVPCFNVQHDGGMVKVEGKKTVDFHSSCPLNPSSVVIVGAGAAGAACADMLRVKGYSGPVTMIGEGEPGPVDRPNLSKDYLAGKAPEEWIMLRTRDHYDSIGVELVTDDPVIRVDPATREVALHGGRTLRYGALLLATGAEAARYLFRARNAPMYTGSAPWPIANPSSPGHKKWAIAPL
jgi:nitrite reductase/ring-hydroxylating ferredoxin subunit